MGPAKRMVTPLRQLLRAGATSDSPIAERPVREFGNFRLDPAERLLLRDGHPVALTPKLGSGPRRLNSFAQGEQAIVAAQENAAVRSR